MRYACRITTTEENEKPIWDFLISKIKNEYGVAGLMGNLFAESSLRPENLQNTFERLLGLSDVQYTDGVNNGTYNNFVHDSAGYGLAQWTFWTRKDGLIKYANERKVPINDRDMQLNYLWVELNTKYTGTLSVLYNATTVKQASDEVLVHFEHPGAVDDPNRVDQVKADRLGYSMIFYNRYAGGGYEPTPEDTYIFEEVDYAPVFNPDYYAAKYADLRKAYGNNATGLFDHFTKYGMKECRQGCKEFNPVTYRKRYSDLDKAYGSDWPAYYKHYCVYGKNEGRKGV